MHILENPRGRSTRPFTLFGKAGDVEFGNFTVQQRMYSARRFWGCVVHHRILYWRGVHSTNLNICCIGVRCFFYSSSRRRQPGFFWTKFVRLCTLVIFFYMATWRFCSGEVKLSIRLLSVYGLGWPFFSVMMITAGFSPFTHWFDGK